MHRSRLTGFVIDCKDADIDEAARFWGAALGRKVKQPAADSDPSYRELDTGPDEPQIFVQRVTHESRVHLDIEADDKEAEVKRLEALGAKNLGLVKRWYVLEAPTGQRFCVVNPQRGPMEDRPNVNQWPDPAP
jgi:hypothetical protein